MTKKSMILVISLVSAGAIFFALNFISEQRTKTLDGKTLLSKVEENISNSNQQKALKLIVLAYKNDDAETRAYGIKKLASIDDPAAIELLMKAVKDKSAVVRESAVIVLGVKHGEGVLQAIKDMLSDSDKKVGKAAFEALRSMDQIPRYTIGDYLRNSKSFASSYPELALLEASDKRVVPAIAKALKENDNETLHHVFGLIQEYHSKDARLVAPLIDFMNKKKDACLSKIVAVFQDDVHVRDKALYREAIDMEEWQFFYSAVGTLCAIKHPDAVEPIFETLNDVRWARLLDEIEAFHQKKKDIELGNEISEARSRIDTFFMNHGGSAVCIENLDAPENHAIVEFCLASIKRTNHVYSTRAIIGTLGFPHNVVAIKPILSAAYRSKNQDTKRFAIRALENIGTDDSAKTLMALLSDRGNDERVYAAQAMGDLKNAMCVDALIASLKDENADVREACAVALGYLNSSKAGEPLMDRLYDGEQRVADACATSLGYMRHKAATEAIMKAVEDGKVSTIAGETAVYNITGREWQSTHSAKLRAQAQENTPRTYQSHIPLKQKKKATLEIKTYPAQ